MEYTKTTWVNGDIITAEKLNNLENGVAGVYPLVTDVEVTLYAQTLNNTWQEIYDALASGRPCYARFIADGETALLTPIPQVIVDNSGPSTAYLVYIDSDQFATDSPNGYPSVAQEPG